MRTSVALTTCVATLSLATSASAARAPAASPNDPRTVVLNAVNETPPKAEPVPGDSKDDIRVSLEFLDLNCLFLPDVQEALREDFRSNPDQRDFRPQTLELLRSKEIKVIEQFQSCFGILKRDSTEYFLGDNETLTTTISSKTFVRLYLSMESTGASGIMDFDFKITVRYRKDGSHLINGQFGI